DCQLYRERLDRVDERLGVRAVDVGQESAAARDVLPQQRERARIVPLVLLARGDVPEQARIVGTVVSAPELHLGPDEVPIADEQLARVVVGLRVACECLGEWSEAGR